MDIAYKLCKPQLNTYTHTAERTNERNGSKGKGS